MKKLFLLIGLAAMGLTASAQNEAVWGVRVGYNLSNMKISSGGESASYDSRSTFQVGVAYQQPLMKHTPLYLETGLYFTGRGTKNFGLVDLSGEGTVVGNVRSYYIQLPVVISWHFNIKEVVSIQPYAGIYYALGISGKIKDAFLIDEEGVEAVDNVDLFKKTDGVRMLKRSDFGLRFGANVVFKKHYHIGLGYDLGLMNVLKAGKELGYGDKLKLKNGAFYIQLGYNF